MELNCQNCGQPLQCVCSISADMSVSGKVERLYSCRQCGSAWSVTTNETTQTMEVVPFRCN